jgi:prepilin-type N-terminal cleavage/methylation domain-containing protein/prepilin-type processing-associated H-X9-DG protein
MASPTRLRRAFTLVELLVVVGVIGILVSILMPTLGRAREAARVVVCQSHLRQISAAWAGYAADHKLAIVGANTGDGCWVQSGNDASSIERGKLFKYLKDLNVYRCPADPAKSNLRTYSINAWLNGESNPTARRTKDLNNPCNTFLLIEEFDPRGYNVNSFGIPATGDSWIDFPATWHNWGCNLSFCDGHIEYWRWDDSVTRDLQTFYATTPNNPDLKRLQRVARF